MLNQAEAKHGQVSVAASSFHMRSEVKLAAPDELDVGQGVGRLVEPQFDPGMQVLEQQLAAIAVIAVY